MRTARCAQPEVGEDFWTSDPRLPFVSVIYWCHVGLRVAISYAVMLLSSGFRFVDVYFFAFTYGLIKKTIHSHLAVHLLPFAVSRREVCDFNHTIIQEG